MTEVVTLQLTLKRGWVYLNKQGQRRIIREELVNDAQETVNFQDSIGVTYLPEGKVIDMPSEFDLVEELFECHGLDTEETVHFYEQDFYVLSNFSSFTLNWKGIRFDTLEAAYHWEKFVSLSGYNSLLGEIQERIRVAPSAHEAFQIAQDCKIMRRHDWDDVKVGIMEQLLRAKVEQHEYVRRKLLATDDRLLVENSWRDDYWGWGPNRDGQNMLGKLWMKIRDDLCQQEAIPTKSEESTVTIIKAPLPAGMKDTPEVRQRLTDFFRRSSEGNR